MTQRETDDNYQPFSQSQYEEPWYACNNCDDNGCYKCEPESDCPERDGGHEPEPDTGSDDDGGCAEWHYNDGEQHDDPPEARECPKCDGSGEYGTGTQASYCYACKGKGWQDAADERRNATYYRHHPSKR